MIRQNINTRICGQCCLAVILNITLEESIALIGHSKGTKSKELLKHFKHSKNKRGYPSQYSLCISRLEGNVGGNWHWILYRDGQIYDPMIGYYIDKDIIDYKISSFFEIF